MMKLGPLFGILIALIIALLDLALLMAVWTAASMPVKVICASPLAAAIVTIFVCVKWLQFHAAEHLAGRQLITFQAQVHAETAVKISEETEAIRQARERENEAHRIELQLKQATMQLQIQAQQFTQWKERTWISPTQYGVLQVQDDGNIQHHLPARIDRAGKQTIPDDTAGDTLLETAIPKAPAFREMAHLIQKDRMPLCFVWDKERGMSVPAYGTIADLLSMGITGKPGRGKTTALMYYVTMLLKNGAEVWVWDPHGAMAELSVLNGRKLPGISATARIVYLDRREDIISSAPALLKELGVRDEMYRQVDAETGKRAIKHPLLLLADELPVLADYDVQLKDINKRLAKQGMPEKPSLIDVIRRFVLEARKWNCFFIGSGQSLDAQVLPTRVVESFNSRIVFFSSDRRARMSGLENDSIETLLPAIRRAGPGIMVFDCARWDEPLIGAIPDITVEDMLAFLGVSGPHASPVGGVWETYGDAHENTGYGVSQDAPIKEIEDLPLAPESNIRRFPVPVTTSAESHVSEPVEPLGPLETCTRGGYRLSEREGLQFLAAYKASSSKKKALAAIGRGSRYNDHAEEILINAGLRAREEAH